MKKKFFGKLRKFNMARSLTLPVFIFAFAIFFALAILAIYICWFANTCGDACFLFIRTGFFAGIVLFFIALHKKKETTKKSAEALDDMMKTHNSFETSVELAGKGHVLENAQLAASARMLEDSGGGSLKSTNRHFRISKEVFAVTLLAAMAFAFALPLYSRTDTGALAHIGHAKNKDGISKIPDVTASLSITYPEPETSAKPIDEIEWDGCGSVSTSFKKISLELFVNGELKKEILLGKENITEENGSFRFSGTFSIGDTGAEPFDVLTYDLKGEVVIDKERVLEIYSQPQFTEIKPLKEDILIVDGMSGDYGEIAEDVKLYIKLQMMLNRITYAARSLVALDKNKEIFRKISELRDEQKALHSKLEKYIMENKNKEDGNVLLTPEMLICLERAAEEMYAAAEKIKKVSGD